MAFAILVYTNIHQHTHMNIWSLKVKSHAVCSSVANFFDVNVLPNENNGYVCGHQYIVVSANFLGQLVMMILKFMENCLGWHNWTNALGFRMFIKQSKICCLRLHKNDLNVKSPFTVQWCLIVVLNPIVIQQPENRIKITICRWLQLYLEPKEEKNLSLLNSDIHRNIYIVAPKKKKQKIKICH